MRTSFLFSPAIGLTVFALALLVSLDLPPPVVRSVAVATLGLALAATWKCRSAVAWISPLLLLGVSSIVFYALLPALSVLWAHPPWFNAGNLKNLNLFVHSPAETRILAFGVFALGLHAINTTTAGSVVSDTLPPLESKLRVLTRLDGVASLALSIAAPVLAAFFYASHWETLVPLAVTLMAMAVILGFGLTDRRLQAVAVLGALSTIVLLLMSHQGKVPVLVGLALALTQISRVRSMVRFLAVLLAMGILVTVALQVMLKTRYPHVEKYIHNSILLFQLNSKAVIRQSDTGRCLNSVIDVNDTNKLSIDLLKLPASILVPRALWPEKPNYSFGRYYMTTYCGVPEVEVAHGSASITLLGQPLILGGRVGQTLAVVAIAAFGLGLTRLARVLGPVGLAALAALTPWVSDFDQDFALYFGNAFKNMLLISPIVLGLWFCRTWATNHQGQDAKDLP